MSAIIGITSYGYQELQTNSRHYEHHYAIPKEYIDSITRAGGIPVMVPASEMDWKTLWPALDGIIVTGGTDVSPKHYHGDSGNSEIQIEAPERDATELALIGHAVETNDKPVLCICRGMQVLNVALGGTLHEHIPAIREKDIHRDEEGLWALHDCHIEAGSHLAGIMGTEKVNTYSGHHQAVDQIADGLQVIATAPDDIVEALTSSDHPWLHGVQWHPEKSAATDPTQQRIFNALVKVAETQMSYNRIGK